MTEEKEDWQNLDKSSSEEETEGIGSPGEEDLFIKKRLTHDEFFRCAFVDKSLVESFVRENFSAELVSQIDFSTLEQSRDTFVDKELSKCYSDVLYHVMLANKPALLYFLFEHKSWEPKFSHIQLLKNMAFIWEKEQVNGENAKVLPPIIPVLLYHGKTKWSSSTQFISQFDVPGHLKKYIPSFEFELFDIPHVPEEQIKGSVKVQMVFMAFRYIFDPEVVASIGKVFKYFSEFTDPAEIDRYLKMVLHYFSWNIENVSPEEFIEAIEGAWKEGGTMSKSIYETLIQRGEESGFKKGEEKKESEIAANCVMLGMEDDAIARVAKIAIEKVRSIREAMQKGMLHFQP